MKLFIWGCTRLTLNSTPIPQGFNAFCLIPEILNAVDVVLTVGKRLGIGYLYRNRRKHKMKNLFLIISILLFSFGCSRDPAETKPKKGYSITSSEIASSEKINKENLSDDSDNDKIIENKQNTFTNKKIQAIYFPDLDISQESNTGYGSRLLIINNNYYLFLLRDFYRDAEYYLIDIEKGEIAEKGKGRDKVDLILKKSIEMDEFNMSHTAIFMEGYSPFCKNDGDCEYYTNYDIGYHFSKGLESLHRGLVMKDTTYSSIGRQGELKIGFFSFSGLTDYPAYSAAKSIVVHNPTRIFVFKGESQSKARLYEPIVPADILSRIRRMWKIDSKGRYLVSFGDEHPFLFMILDIDRGLDIPENHLKNIYFIKYEVLRNQFGKFRDPVLRANELSNWLNNQAK